MIGEQINGAAVHLAPGHHDHLEISGDETAVVVYNMYPSQECAWRGRGYTVGSTLAMAFVPTEAAVDGAEVTATTQDGASHAGKICLCAPYDPDTTRIEV